jgi:hypothetical protein
LNGNIRKHLTIPDANDKVMATLKVKLEIKVNGAKQVANLVHP